MNRILLLLVSLLSFSEFLKADPCTVTVTSSTGYTVNVTLNAVSVIPSTTNCPFGFNYNVSINYNIVFSGSNIPASLYTLQGTLDCGSQSLFFDLPNGQGSGNTVTNSNPYVSTATCNTATVANLGCNRFNVQIEGLGIPYQVVSCSFVTLPVEFVAFDANRNDDQVDLFWATGAEQNNQYFEVQRAGESGEWTAIGRLNGVGTTSQTTTYNYADQSPLDGISYYRLKQVDYNGNFSYSPIKKVEYNSQTQAPELFPNPSSGEFLYVNGLDNPLVWKLKLYSTSGALVLDTQVQTGAVPLPLLAPGLYFVRLENTVSGEQHCLRYFRSQ